jgi:hypothetical protein
MKKCPPGVICIENVSMFFIIIFIFIFIFLILYFVKQNIVVNNNNKPSEKIIIKEEKRENVGGGLFGFGWPNIPYSNLSVPRDALLNPYVPPLSDERYIVPTFPGIVPINVSTNIGAVDTTYRQMGILTPVNNKDNKEKIIPLMGRPLFTNRDKWQYYTISDQRNSIKLPILFNGRSCTNEYGCNRLFSGDTVYVEGINRPYKVNIYENDTIKYLPFI